MTSSGDVSVFAEDFHFHLSSQHSVPANANKFWTVITSTQHISSLC